MARLAIKFDLSSISQKNVTKAEVAIFHNANYQDKTPYNGSGKYSIFKLSKNWDSKANWNLATASVNWNKAGGDFATTELGSYNYSGTGFGWETFDVTSTINDFLANPTNNYGFIIMVFGGKDSTPAAEDPSLNQTSVYFSSHYKEQSLRPKLTLTTNTAIKFSGNSIALQGVQVRSLQKKVFLYMPIKGEKEIGIFDMSGKTLYSSKTTVSNFWQELPIQLNNGVYVVLISQNGNTALSKISITDY